MRYELDGSMSFEQRIPFTAGKLRSPLFMPYWAARTWLEVAGVRAERLQEITEEGAKAEGVQPWAFDPQQPMTTGELGADSPYRGGFAVLWDDFSKLLAQLLCR